MRTDVDCSSDRVLAGSTKEQVSSLCQIARRAPVSATRQPVRGSRVVDDSLRRRSEVGRSPRVWFASQPGLAIATRRRCVPSDDAGARLRPLLQTHPSTSEAPLKTAAMARTSLVLLAIAARVAALPPLKRTGSLRPQHGALTIKGGNTKKTVTRNPRAVVVQKRTDVLGASFNLVNNVAGCGFLTLTAGAAGTGYLPAIGLVAFLGAVSCGSFLLLGEDALRYQASDVRSLWSEAVGANAWAVDASVAAFCGAAAVIYHGIVGDVFGPLVEKYLDIPPSITVYAVALLALFPLCQLDLATLAKFSFMGCASVFLTAFAILYRAVDGTYGEDGIHRASAVASEATGGCCGVSAKALVLSANLGLAYVAHYNAPPLAESLARGDGGARRRFRQVTFLSFTVLVALYAGVMAAGKATFGDAARE